MNLNYDKDSFKYASILHLSRPASEDSLRKHPRMSLGDRAKIFSPFAALQGHSGVIMQEAGKTLLTEKILLSEEELSKLSDQLSLVQKGMSLSVLYFQREQNEGSTGSSLGRYVFLEGTVLRVDPVDEILILSPSEDPETSVIIPMNDLSQLSLTK